MTRMPKKHGFLTDGDREYISQAIDAFPELAGTKKARHDFNQKLSSWLLDELKQTLDDWCRLTDYFYRAGNKQLFNDLQEAIWALDDNTGLLSDFIREWIPPESRKEFLGRLPTSLLSGYSDAFSPTQTIPAYSGYLTRLRFDSKWSDGAELEKKRIDAIKALEALNNSIELKQFCMNWEHWGPKDPRTGLYFDEFFKVVEYGEIPVYLAVAYQINPTDNKILDRFKGTNQILKFETEAVPSMEQLGSNVKVHWRVDIPLMLLYQYSIGEVGNWEEVIKAIKSWIVDVEPQKYEVLEGENDKRKIEVFRVKGVEKEFLRCEILFRHEEMKPPNPSWQVLGTIPFNNVVQTLDRIMGSKYGNASNIKAAQNTLLDMKLIRPKKNRNGFEITKKGGRIARYLYLGKSKRQAIECWLSYEEAGEKNDRPIVRRVDIKGNLLSYLGLRSDYGTDL